MTLRIRAATRDDAASIAALGRELNIHQRDPVELFDEAAVRRDGFGDAPHFEGVIAELDGEAVGYALFHIAYETGQAARGLYMVDLYVREGAQRRGIGRALVAAVARIAKDRGKSFVWWATKDWNTDAQAFYRSLGAIEEPVVAHALFGEAFEALVEQDRSSRPDSD